MTEEILSVDTKEVLKKGDKVWIVQTTKIGSAPKLATFKGRKGSVPKEQESKYYKLYVYCLDETKRLNKKHKKLA